MVVLSKLFKESLQSKSCHDLLHPGSCTANAALNSYKFLLANARYFAPIILLPLLVKIKKFDRSALKILQDTLKYYLNSFLLGTATGWTIHVFICIFRNLFGEFRYPFFTFVPTIIGSIWGISAPPRIYRLFKTAIAQCMIETFLVRRKNVIAKLIADSVVLQTCIFMCCSACILQAKQSNRCQGFWFMAPSPQPQPTGPMQHEQQDPTESPSQSSTCTHKNSTCTQYLIRGLRNYAAIGVMLDIIKMFMYKTPAGAGGALAKLLIKMSNFRLSSTALMASYVGIYRSVQCYLNRRSAADMELNHLVAGFLAGASYIFLPKYTLLSYATVLNAEILWNLFVYHNHWVQKPNTFVKLLQKFPTGQTLYALSLSHLVHVYSLRRKYISPMGEVIINGLTDNYAKNIYLKVEHFEKLMEIGMKTSK